MNMSPVATSTPLPTPSGGGELVTFPVARKTSPPAVDAGPEQSHAVHATMAQDITPRRPSPWHVLAHSLSTTSIPGRRPSSSISTTPPLHSQPSPGLSTSQALREWEARLAMPSPSVSRHALVPPRSPSSPRGQYQSEGTPSPSSAPVLVPKLVPERDKEGHIEYKLKLIDPSPDRFERLVTQMMWRLKQGRNEAIYELGLADDGTVVGLSRADMDASLRTLELMASEVGATVIVLKEIVLAAPTFPQRGSARNDSPAGWVVPMIPLHFTDESEEQIRTRKNKKKGWSRARRREAVRSGQGPVERDVAPNAEKQIVFDLPEDEDDDDDEEDSEDEVVLGDRDDRPDALRQQLRAASANSALSRSDEDVFPFDLDIGDASKPDTPRQLSAKARKALLRREARRLDLLRGDGTSTLALHPHAPSRPSSLRLTSPAPPPAATLQGDHDAGDADDGQGDDGAFIQRLLGTPLDSLSLSFANVQRVSGNGRGLSSRAPDDPASVSTAARVAVGEGEEKICVEALVVRKVVHEEEEDGWWGGQDDGWGFTPEDEDEGESCEIDEEGWGF